MSFVAASLQLDDGRIVRFGGDEASPENVPYNISWDTSIPGGFGVGSLTVPRPENLTADDAKLFADVTIYGRGAKTLYEGYVTGVPQVGPGEIELQLSGWSTSLDRIQTFRQIFVDRDLSRWRGPSRQRRQNAMSGLWSTYADEPSTQEDFTNGLPALALVLPANQSNIGCEAWYDAGPGNGVSSFYYDMTSRTTSSHVFDIYSCTGDDATGAVQILADQLTGTNSASSGTVNFAARRFLLMEHYMWPGTVGTKDADVTIRNLAVFGDHGLTKRGTAPNEGYFASDVVGYIASRAPLNIATDSIEPSSFVIPHLVFDEDVTLTQAIEQVSALGGSQNVRNDWGVYEDRTFFWRTPGTYGRVWRVRRDEVATSSSEGPDADRRVAGVKVLYEDGAGTSLSVGPPGSNSDFETADLLDTDPMNPAFRIPGAFAVESVGITSRQGAINIGTMILNERNTLQWRGSIDLQGEVTDSNGNTYPVSEVRAGDQIVIADDPDTSPRPINETSYSHDGQNLTASVGARPDSLEALLSQLAAVTERL